jgi:hypothetical protein
LDYHFRFFELIEEEAFMMALVSLEVSDSMIEKGVVRCRREAI